MTTPRPTRPEETRRGDELGDRMKRQYEDRFRSLLPRRTYVIMRLDGRAFHTYTQRAQKPFDAALKEGLADAALQLCREADGAQFAYLQSDEISLVLTDFATTDTQSWFDGNVQKIVSVGASSFTAYFAESNFAKANGVPSFDARVFVIPDPVEVENYFIWRQKDWLRNSVQMLARHHFSHKDLFGKSKSDMHEMLHAIGVNWSALCGWEKNGHIVFRAADGWASNAAPIFTREREWFAAHLPRYT